MPEGSGQVIPGMPIATLWRDTDVVGFGVGVAVDANDAGMVVGQVERPYAERTRFNPSLSGVDDHLRRRHQ